MTERSRKISDKIMDVAQPWVRRLGWDPPLAAKEAAHLFAMSLWNARRTPHQGEDDSPTEQLANWLRGALAGVRRREVRSLMEEMLSRAARYDDDPRMVLNVQVEPLGEGRFRVNAVAATFSNSDRE